MEANSRLSDGLSCFYWGIYSVIKDSPPCSENAKSVFYNSLCPWQMVIKDSLIIKNISTGRCIQVSRPKMSLPLKSKREDPEFPQKVLAAAIGCHNLAACLLISGPTLDRRKSKLSGDILIYLGNVTNRKGT